MRDGSRETEPLTEAEIAELRTVADHIEKGYTLGHREFEVTLAALPRLLASLEAERGRVERLKELGNAMADVLACRPCLERIINKGTTFNPEEAQAWRGALDVEKGDGT